MITYQLPVERLATDI